MISLIKLILIIGIIYAVIKIRKVLKRISEFKNQNFPGTENARIDDVMIKDPFCEIYFPKREGHHLKYDGKDLYFCSSTCREKFIAGRSEKQNV
jgi:YHS domain-containing protein